MQTELWWELCMWAKFTDASDHDIDHKTASAFAISIVHSKLNYCNSLYYNLPNTQLIRLQHIHNSLARAVVMAPKSSHINPALKSLQWLKMKQRMDYKILSLTYKLLTTTQPAYLHNLISVQPHHSTRYSDVATLSRSPFSSSLKINNRSFRHASSCLWNQLSKELRLPIEHEDLSLSSDLTHVSSSFPSSPLSPYSFSLPLQAQNSSFPQILSSIVLLSFYPPDWLHGL